MTQANTGRCLLLIDLQNEFLSPKGNFPIHEASRGCILNITQQVDAFHSRGDTIIWVRSEYGTESVVEEVFGTTKSNSTVEWGTFVLHGTHTGRRPCCYKDTPGARFPDEIAELVEITSPQSLLLTKHWYCAFKKTTLQAELEARGVTELYVAGVVTNICVLSTVTEARTLKFDVTVLEDCLGWRNRESHDKAIGNMRNLGAQVACGYGGIGEPEETQTAPLQDAPQQLPILYYVNGSIPSWRVFMALHEKRIQFEAKRLRVMSSPKQTRLPDFLTLNHRGKTPVFVDIIQDSSVAEDTNPTPVTTNVNESLAILQYIETYHKPEIPLLPPVTQRASRALALCRIQETENLHNAYDALENAYFDAAKAGMLLDDAEHAQLAGAVQKELDYWEAYAAKTKFIGGNEFGLADCAFFPLLGYMVHRGFKWKQHQGGGDAWPCLKTYFSRVWNRGGQDGCAKKAQPSGWNRQGKSDVWYNN